MPGSDPLFNDLPIRSSMSMMGVSFRTLQRDRSMKGDSALATALAASIGFGVLLGVSTSRMPEGPGGPNPLVDVVITYAEGRVKRVTGHSELSSISQWLDDVFDNPRSEYDVRNLPAAENVLVLHFAEGDTRTISFSVSSTEATYAEDATQTVLVEFEDQSYTIDRVPRSFRLDAESDTPDGDIPPELREYREHTTEDG